MSSHNEASRQARRELAARVRNDWEYPNLPEYRQRAVHPSDHPSIALDSAHDDKVEGSNPSSWDEHAVRPLTFEPVGWQERGYASSESTPTETPAADFMDIDPPDGKKTGSTAGKQSDHIDLITRRDQKKRKWAQLLEEEIEWNTGLAHFVNRRNAWTSARSPSSAHTASTASDLQVPSMPLRAVLARNSGDSLNTDVSTPASSPPPTGEAGHAILQTMLPIPEPLLLGNPVRAKINSSAYGEIYMKVVMQCRTPTVPINLADIMKACVKGWITEGNFPPKPGVPDPLGLARRRGERHPHLRKGVQAVSRVFGLGASDEKEKDREREHR